MDTVLWLCLSLSTEILKWLSSLPILMHESFWWWQCSDRYIISLYPHLHTPFSPFLTSLAVSADVKHHVYLTLDSLAREQQEHRDHEQTARLDNSKKCVLRADRKEWIQPVYTMLWQLARGCHLKGPSDLHLHCVPRYRRKWPRGEQLQRTCNRKLCKYWCTQTPSNDLRYPSSREDQVVLQCESEPVCMA